MERTSNKKKTVAQEASHNLFADHNIADATEKNAKVQLAVAINQLIRGMSQREAASRMDCTQPDVSALTHYNLRIFSIERLIAFLLALGKDVEIRIRQKHDRKKPAATTVKLEPEARRSPKISSRSVA
jgi:predicted XRE-type DNA-binding protein